MISATRRWLRRNRTSIGIGVGVIGVGYVAGQYIISKISEAGERMTSDRIAKENLRRRFQQNQEDCTILVLELLPTVTENILEALPSEQITEEIKQKKAERLGRSVATSEIAPSEISSGNAEEDGRSLSSLQSESYLHASQMGSSNLRESQQTGSKTKVQLWSDLKISTMTRSVTLLYIVSLLSLLTRIQLNLLGRRNYFSSVVLQASYPLQSRTINLENHENDTAERSSYGNDFETNRKYLTYSWWLMHRGWKDIRTAVEAAVKEVFGPLKPTEEIPLERLSALILDVRRKIEGSTPEERRTRKYLPYLLPPRSEEDTLLLTSGISTPETSPHPSSSPALRRLLDETADLIDSPQFTHVVTRTLDATFSYLVDNKLRAEAYHIPPLPHTAPFAPSSSATPSSRVEDVTEETDARAKLATILAVVTREAHTIGGRVPNPYVQALEGVGEVEAFGAVIFAGEEEGRGVIEEGEEDVMGEEGGSGIVGGVVDKAWSGFDSVWGRVSGREG